MRHQYSRVSESKQTYSTSSIDKKYVSIPENKNKMSSSASKMLIVCFLVKDFKQQWLKISSFLCC